MCQFFITNDEKTLSAFAPRAGLAHHTVKMLEAIDKHHHLALLAHCTVILLKHTMMASTCAPADDWCMSSLSLRQSWDWLPLVHWAASPPPETGGIIVSLVCQCRIIDFN